MRIISIILTVMLVCTLLLTGCSNQQSIDNSNIQKTTVDETKNIPETIIVTENNRHITVVDYYNIPLDYLENEQLNNLGERFSDAFYGRYGVSHIPVFRTSFVEENLLGHEVVEEELSGELDTYYASLDEAPISQNYIAYQVNDYEEFTKATNYKDIGAYDIQSYEDDIINYANELHINIENIFDCYLGLPLLVDLGDNELEWLFPINYVSNNQINIIGLLYYGGVIPIEGIDEYNNTNTIITSEYTWYNSGYQLWYDVENMKCLIDEIEGNTGNFEIRLDPTYPLPINMLYL